VLAVGRAGQEQDKTMPRRPRVVIPGFPHHVTQRGNRRSNIFLSDDDRRCYLYLLQTYTRRYGLGLWSYSLMTNHIHLLGVPEHKSSLSNSLRDTHSSYARYFNDKYGLTGHLWQGRFFSCPLDDTHFRSAVRYIERNPVRAGMVTKAEDYPWSSAAANCGIRRDPLLSEGLSLKLTVPDWSEWLAQETPREELEKIRDMTRLGQPCGSKEFVAELEKLLGQKFNSKPRRKKRQ